MRAWHQAQLSGWRAPHLTAVALCQPAQPASVHVHTLAIALATNAKRRGCPWLPWPAGIPDPHDDPHQAPVAGEHDPAPAGAPDYPGAAKPPQVPSRSKKPAVRAFTRARLRGCTTPVTVGAFARARSARHPAFPVTGTHAADCGVPIALCRAPPPRPPLPRRRARVQGVRSVSLESNNTHGSLFGWVAASRHTRLSSLISTSA